MTGVRHDAEAVEHSFSVALVSTFPPTECGLATFASNLREAMVGASGWDVPVVQVLERPAPRPGPAVVAQWVASDPGTLDRAAGAVNGCHAVLLQHEYGIYPGPDGSGVLDLADDVRVPLVTVLHTALTDPTPHQRSVLDRLLQRSSHVVVQSEVARRRVLAVNHVRPGAVEVIPHGAAANLLGRPADVPHPMVLTWGLLSPGKGIEHALAALARLPASRPAPTYVVAGRTHPKVAAAEGERYRDSLIALAGRLGVRTRFEGAYLDWESLHALVRAADVVLLPYESVDQVSSGVLVEALASGKPVVATRFPHAVELLAGGAGLLVEHGDIGGMAEALRRVLHEPGLAAAMARQARRAAEQLLWPAIGARYRDLLERVIVARAVA